MSKDHTQPINEPDRQARAAFKALFDGIPTRVSHGLLLEIGLNYRTFQRILAGERDVPPGLALSLADWLGSDHDGARDAQNVLQGTSPDGADIIAALKAWATERGVQSTRKLFPSLKEWEDECKAALARGDWQAPDA